MATKSVGDAGTTFHYQWWVPFVIFVAGLGVVLIELGCRNRPGWNGWAVAAVGLFFALALGPAMSRDCVLVNKQGFEASSGFLGTAPKQKVEFDNVRSVRITHEKRILSRIRKPAEVLYFEKKTGGAARFSLANDVNIAAAKAILAWVARNGIRMNLTSATRYHTFKP